MIHSHSGLQTLVATSAYVMKLGLVAVILM
jgi:hypothetical protein